MPLGFRQTDKQTELMGHILARNPDGSWLDTDQLMEKISYGPISKQALLCSLEFLVEHEMIEKAWEIRRLRRRMVLKPTAAAYVAFRNAMPAS